jgi:hypothetical protein
MSPSGKVNVPLGGASEDRMFSCEYHGAVTGNAGEQADQGMAGAELKAWGCSLGAVRSISTLLNLKRQHSGPRCCFSSRLLMRSGRREGANR